VPARSVIAASVVALALGAVACTRSGATPPPSPSPSGATGTTTGPRGPVEFVPGEYVFDFAGVKAALSFDGNSASLSVTNRTGAELGPPTISVWTREGKRSEAVVEDAAPLADGEQVELTVRFEEGIDRDTVGAVELGFGGEVWSWMAPRPVAG
jgi:hypothetical protein